MIMDYALIFIIFLEKEYPIITRVPPTSGNGVDAIVSNYRYHSDSEDKDK